MSSERGRIALIFAGVGVAVIGALFYFFKVYQPKQVRSGAQAEITQWEERFTAARGCLFGPKPASPRAAEALAVRELSSDPWDRSACTKLVGKLTRGLADDSGLMPVEHAWMAIDRAAAKVATAFASHVEPLDDLPPHRDMSPLPAALEALDVARADLRKAAGMDPPLDANAPPLPQAELIPLRDGTGGVALEAWSMPSAYGVLAFSKGAREIGIVLTAGAAPKLVGVPRGGVIAMPDGAWGASQLGEQVAVGAIDANGGMSAPSMIPAPALQRLLFASGSLANGFLAWGNRSLVFAHSTNGVFTVDKPVAFDSMAFTLDPTGRGAIAWNTSEGALRGMIVTPGTSPKVIELGSGSPAGACLTATHAWTGGDAADGQFVSFDDTSATPHVLPAHELVGCTAKAALLHKFVSTHYAVCTESCRSVDLTGTTSTPVVTLVDDKLVAIRARDHVIGVWRENGEPTFYAMPDVMTPLLAITDGKVIDVLASSHESTPQESTSLVRLPAR